MKVKELYDSVSRLGFETALSDETGFFYAVDRALTQIARDIPHEKTVTILHMPPKKCTYNLHWNDESFVASAIRPAPKRIKIGYCLPLIVNIIVNAEVVDVLYLDEVNQYAWREASKLLRNSSGDFLNGDIEIKATGDTSYPERLKLELFAENDEIEYNEAATMIIHKMISYAGDFFEFEPNGVKHADGRSVSGDLYRVENEKLLLSTQLEFGYYNIKYKASAGKIKDEERYAESEVSLNIDDESASVLPLLVAAYVWLDDDPSKASYYMTLYQERARIITEKRRRATPVKITHNGW